MAASLSLREELHRLRELSRDRIPAEHRETMARATEELFHSGIAAKAVPVGGSAPGFALPNVRGETIRLGDLLGRGPVVLAFYRGGW